MMDMLAYCGLDCKECPAYRAKRSEDKYLQEKTAKEWSTAEWTVEPEEVSCDGCKSDGDLFKHCAVCRVKSCAKTRNVTTCAHCEDYKCDKLETLLDVLGKNARTRLDKIRSTL
ncbi:MAG: hypothetical protein BAJATHORv1_10505 [Candidatus Thorarchaeota archaeon]|nr:MAG: hypothetical protein BAJATHORv1_10505 [Candidatus Thorarchaeota archaeon]